MLYTTEVALDVLQESNDIWIVCSAHNWIKHRVASSDHCFPLVLAAILRCYLVRMRMRN
jgi:hypothetical protein